MDNGEELQAAGAITSAVDGQRFQQRYEPLEPALASVRRIDCQIGRIDISSHMGAGEKA